MKYTFEAPSGLNQRVLFNISSEIAQEKADSALNAALPNLEIKGFRRGKVPKDVALQKHKESLVTQILQDFVQEAFEILVKKEDIKPAASPEIEVQTADLEKGIEFTLSYDTFPVFSTPDLSNVDVEKLESSVEDSNVQEAIDRILSREATYDAVKRPLASGDRVRMDFEGFLGDEAFEGGAAQNHEIIVGQGQLIPGFEDQMIGMSVGESKDINVTFPDDYGSENLKGKAARFHVTINSIEEAKLPPLNEELFKKFVQKGEPTEENFKQELKQQLTRELDRNLEQKNRQAAYEALQKAVDIPLPESLIREETKRLRDQMQEYMAQQMGKKLEEGQQMPLEAFSEEGKKRVHISLIVRQFIEDEKIDPSEDDVDAFIRERAAEYEKSEIFFQHYKKDEKRFEEMKQRLIERLVLSALFEKMKTNIVKKKSTEVR